MMEKKEAVYPASRELIRGRFLPTMVYARERDGFHTRLCVYNYFSELFPDAVSGATVFLWFFDDQGKMVAQRAIPIGFRGQLQFDVASIGIAFEGIAAVSLVPDAAVPARHHRLVGTGYFVYYSDDAGHADCSHEWEPMRMESSQGAPWICLVRPRFFPDTHIVVMNAYFGDDARAGAAEWTARLRDGQGHCLASRAMAPLPARGSARFALSELFPDIAARAERADNLAVEVQGSNIQGPFTWVQVSSGDFNIHHFC